MKLINKRGNRLIALHRLPEPEHPSRGGVPCGDQNTDEYSTV